MQDDEMLDLVNENDCIIGQERRSEVYRQGLCNFRVVNAFLVNSSGQLWIPRRSPQKRIFPLCLDISMGGHVESGESYETALERELQEELNLKSTAINCKNIGYLTPYKHQVSAFMKVYEIKTDCEPNYNKNDFINAFWLYPDKLLDWLDNGEPAKSDLAKLVRIFYPTLTN